LNYSEYTYLFLKQPSQNTYQLSVNNNLYAVEEKHVFEIFQILQIDKIVIENYIKKVCLDIPESFSLKYYYTFVLLYQHLVDTDLTENHIFLF